MPSSDLQNSLKLLPRKPKQPEIHAAAKNHQKKLIKPEDKNIVLSRISSVILNNTAPDITNASPERNPVVKRLKVLKELRSITKTGNEYNSPVSAPANNPDTRIAL